VLRRRRRSEPVDPPRPVAPEVGPRWRPSVDAATSAGARFDALVAPVAEGPLRQRLEELGAHLAEGIERCWAAAARADRLEQVVSSLDAEGVTAAHKDARRRLAAEVGEPPAALAESARLLAEQHARVQGLLNALSAADERLGVLRLRLDDIVLRAAELLLARDGAGQADALDRDLDGLVDELDALRAGLDAVG
jgi:hypothetical protein